jgi:hypothetical protein
MATTAASRSTVPSSPTSHYRARREAGSDHERAVAEVSHSYGRNDFGHLLARVRDEYEHAEAIQSQDDRVALDDPPAPVDDAFTVAEDQVRAKIATLTALRQALSFDAIADATKANELAGVESDLAAAERELERTRLARAESTRREREAQEVAEQERRAKAQERAAELGEQRQRADQKLTKAGVGFAQALAAVEGIAAQQSEAMSDAGHGWQQLGPSRGQLQRIISGALIEANAPTGWLGP